MVGAGRGDDAIPDDGLIGRVCCRVVGRWPLSRYVDEDLLGVPCEERGEVGIEREVDDGVFFLFAGVVVRSASNAVVVWQVWLASDIYLGIYMAALHDSRHGEVMPGTEGKGFTTHTWTLVVLRVRTIGARSATKSEAAMKAATTKATVVKKPNTFCSLTTDVYMVGDRWMVPCLEAWGSRCAPKEGVARGPLTSV